jgi:hypothetical protein
LPSEAVPSRTVCAVPVLPELCVLHRVMSQTASRDTPLLEMPSRHDLQRVSANLTASDRSSPPRVKGVHSLSMESRSTSSTAALNRLLTLSLSAALLEICFLLSAKLKRIASCIGGRDSGGNGFPLSAGGKRAVERARSVKNGVCWTMARWLCKAGRCESKSIPAKRI